MPRWISIFAVSVVLFGCVALGAQEPPQFSRDGDVAPSERTTFKELGLEVTDLAIDLDTPWDLLWGPDGWIWFTERPGRVSRVDPATGELHLLAEIPTEEQGESGLLGMELHPDFPETPYVYFLQSYSEGGEIANRLLRYSFEAGALRNREVIIDGILGNTYHDGARLAFGPSGYLYVTTGDAGRPRVAQDTEALNGKVLRVTADREPATAGADFYDSGLIPGWRGSFLFVTLKGSALYRLELSEDGGGVESQTIISQGRYGRLRDVLVNPDGVVYIATSNRDGRGDPAANDDRILMIRPEE